MIIYICEKSSIFAPEIEKTTIFSTKMSGVLLNIVEGAYAEFYGLDVFLYYIYSIRTWMQEYSWQVRLSYAIILACIVTMIVLMFLFARNIRRRRNYEDAYEHCTKTYEEPFFTIIHDENMLTDQQIFELCDVENADDFQEYNGLLYADIITHIRMSLHNILYLPNLQRLMELTGARLALEGQLKARRDVLQTLQIINTLPLVVNEGLLAVYTSHNRKQVSQLARISHMTSSSSEPYLYFLNDMNEPHDPWYRITIHRILGWKREQNIPMPPIQMLANTCENPKMAAFLVEEISYWGTEQEKKDLYNYFEDPRVDCRLAALRSITRMGQADCEQRIMDSYESQPQVVRRAMQHALCSFHSGKYTNFFVSIYQGTPSHISRQTALECLYNYTAESRVIFEELAQSATEEQKVLFDQIRTTYQLQEKLNQNQES